MRTRDWLRCKDAESMVRLVWTFQGFIQPRRYRLFVLKAGERLWKNTDCEPLREAIDSLRISVDSGQSQQLVFGEWADRFHAAGVHYDDRTLEATLHVAALLFEHPHGAALELVGYPRTLERIRESNPDVPERPVLLAPEELLDSCRLIREFFGFQGGPPPLDPCLLTTTAVSLARQIDESQDFSLMPLLGDALEDAGGRGMQGVVDHCRSKEEHERGCWVIDGLLGRD